MFTAAVPDTTLDSEEMVALSEMLEGGIPKLRGQRGEEMALPEPLYGVLKEAVRNLRMGVPVSVVSEEEQLSTQMAAQVLGCSRPHVIKLLEAGEMPFEMVGAHRRIRTRDLMAYRKRREAGREAWTEFVREAVREGYYVGTALEEGQSDE